jgi:hypothetical protein
MDRILGVAIGVATVCLILSIIASHVQELWASFSARRAASLETALEQMLGDPSLAKAFFDHPLIRVTAFSPTRSGFLRRNAPVEPRPSYVASDLFNKVLQSILVSTHRLTATGLPAIVAALPDCSIKSRVATLTSGLEADSRACNAAVEKWYDDTMDRINGLYKRNTQVVLLCLGLFLAILCNANLLHVAATLWNSSAARDELTAMAQVLSRQASTTGSPAHPTSAETASSPAPAIASPPAASSAMDPTASHELVFNAAKTNLESLPIGYGGSQSFLSYWREATRAPLPHLSEWTYNILGWVLTAVAISLGAPFWFDLINKFVNIRMVGQKPSTAEKLDR